MIVTRPLRGRYVAATWPLHGCYRAAAAVGQEVNRYITVTSPLFGRSITVTFPFITVTHQVEAAVEEEVKRYPTEGPTAAVDGAPDRNLDGNLRLEVAAGADVALLSGQELSDGGVGGGQRRCCDCAPRAGSWRAKIVAVVTSDEFGNVST